MQNKQQSKQQNKQVSKLLIMWKKGGGIIKYDQGSQQMTDSVVIRYIANRSNTLRTPAKQYNIVKQGGRNNSVVDDQYGTFSDNTAYGR